MIAKLAGGLSRNRVAREVGAAISTVVTTAKRFEEAGIAGLYDRRRFNGPRKVDAPFHHALTMVLRSTPQDFGVGPNDRSSRLERTRSATSPAH
jgi:transposase